MIKTVYTYPQRQKGSESIANFALERNKNLARYFAAKHNAEYKGELDPATPVGVDEYVLLHAPIAVNDPVQFEQKNFYGSVGRKIHSLKSIFHPALPGVDVPPDYPHEFLEFLQSQDILPKGYTAFSKAQIVQACELLIAEGYVPRLKDPFGSGGAKQRVVTNINELQQELSSYKEEAIEQFGFVVEANLINNTDPTKPVPAFSGAFLDFEGEEYCYLAKQMTGETDTDRTYLGTRLHMAKGGLESAQEMAEQVEMQHVREGLQTLKAAMQYLPDLVVTRGNFDFLYGVYEGSNGNGPVLLVCDQAFRIGGASVAEFVAKDYLDSHPEAKYVTAVSRVHYGPVAEAEIGSDSEVFYNGVDPEVGEVQAWGYIERAHP